MKNATYDAVVIGSGPNGMAAAICLAQKNLKVLVIEARQTIGGGARTAELTLPGFQHDICSSVHPLAIGSPFFKTLPLEKYGLEFIQPPASLAHPLADGTAVLLRKSVEETCSALGHDGENYRNLIKPFVENWDSLAPEILGPLHFPKHPVLLAKFGLKALLSARRLAQIYFSDIPARAVFAGIAAHGMVPLEYTASAAAGLVLMIAAHSAGWAFPRGGAVRISEALAGHFLALGGQLETNRRIENIDELPASRAVLFDLTPQQIVKIAGHRLPAGYKKQLEKFRYGAGAFKMDFALSEPIPWRAAGCAESATVHLGGTLDEIAESERAHEQGKISQNPFVLVTQTSLFDDSRAPAGRQTAWTYAHVPNNSSEDVSEIIESRIERFAPGFRDCILAKNIMFPADLQKYNANYIGGDINGGASVLSQLFTRPAVKIDPYSMPAKGLYICSSSTPPGGGVHGMCGYQAAQSVLSNEFR